MPHIWYEGISHQYASAVVKVKVICKGQGNIRLHFSKNGRFAGIRVSQTHLVPQCFQKASHTGSLKVVIVW